MAAQHNKPRPSVNQSSAPREEALISRRRLLYGAVGVGALAAVGVGAFAYNAAQNGSSDEIPYLDAPASALTTLNDFEALDDAAGSVQLVGDFDLPYGSLVFANDEKIAACLLPTETGSPLAQVGLLFLGSGMLDTVLEKAMGFTESFEIYDVRANSSGMVWTEANILQGTWRIYTARIDNGTMTGTKLAAEGNDAFDTPTIAVAGKRAFWLENPKAPSESGLTARLMAVPFGSDSASVIYESKRRMSTPPYASSDSITIAPRVDSASTYYELTNIDADTGEVRDTLILPHAVAPIEGGYGPTGFMFSFPDIYDYKGAIANLGTYTPFEYPAGGNYNDAKWFDFSRTPTAAPAWCDNMLIVKSTRAVCGIDLESRTYFAIDVENGADTYGEYLASTGTHNTFVTFTNIDHKPINESAVHTCKVKVWAPLSPSERAAYQKARQEEQETIEA